MTTEVTTKEVYRDIPGYEGCYQASNLGSIKNLGRKIKRSRGGMQVLKETVIRQHTNKSGYKTVALSVNGKPKTKYVHRLVAATFYGESKLVVDHINGNRSDNSIENLRYCTPRENTTFDNVKRKNRTGFKGVDINGKYYKKKFRARIVIGKKLRDLGSYHTAEEAHSVYKSATQKLINK